MIGQVNAGDKSPRISVVIPTLNEARNIPHVFSLLPDNLHEVILVDGHSVDDTVEIARKLRPDVRIVMQTRLGKGNALACGFAAARGDIIAMVDADGSTDIRELPNFVQALLDGADFAKGSRFKPGGGSADITRLRSLGNRLLSGCVNVLYNTRYSDLCYGYNVFWRRIVPSLDLDIFSPPSEGPKWGDGFEIETLINIRVARTGLAVTEVPSFEYARIHGVSNLNAVRDGLRVLRTILREYRLPHRKAGAHRTQASPRPSAEVGQQPPGLEAAQQSPGLRPSNAGQHYVQPSPAAVRSAYDAMATPAIGSPNVIKRTSDQPGVVRPLGK